VSYSVIQFSKSQIDKAGAKLARIKPYIDDDDRELALEIMNNYRAAHNLPLLVFRVDLATRARKVDVTVTLAQRLKRMPAIEAKLRRLSSMRLTQMEDIGGCRAVVRSVQMVRRLRKMYEKSRSKHKRLHIVDYLTAPRETGYRGVHLIYAYHSNTKPQFNGLKIEIQLRSRPQHAWATAVETVDAFTGQGLKDGSGDTRWRRFFALMGTYIALKEACNPVPDTPTNISFLKKEIAQCAKELQVLEHLHSYRATLEMKTMPGAHFYIVDLDVPKGETRISGFREDALETAQQMYLALEKETTNQLGRDVVLVSVGSMESLKRAYPNYFADTDVFVGLLNEATS
jgi:ppGpp synthetase/RelA/SpoT-type nucleotidyltranferase